MNATSCVPWAEPMFRWAGSKRKLIPDLLPRVPEFDRYIEPFAGSACLFFALRPSKAILGDCNSALLRAYATVRQHPRKVYRIAASWPRTEEFYYKLRDAMLGQVTDSLTESARFVYLNRYCFNGVFRTNRSGHFNVPRGRKVGSFPESAIFYRCAVALRNAELVNADFEKCVNTAGSGDFVYLDPPYAKVHARFRGEYGYGSFCVDDVERLLRCLNLLNRRKAKFLLSYSYCKEIKPAMEQWFSRSVLVRRHVAGFARYRQRVKEVLIANYRLN